jgi:hypothetical protein
MAGRKDTNFQRKEAAIKPKEEDARFPERGEGDSFEKIGRKLEISRAAAWQP